MEEEKYKEESGKYYVFDIETTGNDLGHNCPIQFCMTEFDVDKPDHKRIVESIYINPVEPILPMGMAIHGLCESILKAKGSINFKPAIEKIHAAFSQYKDQWILGYNHEAFDLPILNKMFTLYKLPEITLSKSFDVFMFAKKMIDITDIGGYKLDAVFLWLFNDDKKEKAIEALFSMRAKHSADVDIVLTNIVMKLLLKRFVVNDFADAVKLMSVAKEITIFPFGKYKGMPIKEVFTSDQSYIQWLVKSKDEMSVKYPDLMYTIFKLFNDVK